MYQEKSGNPGHESHCIISFVVFVYKNGPQPGLPDGRNTINLKLVYF
jgi:hypothetical protein